VTASHRRDAAKNKIGPLAEPEVPRWWSSGAKLAQVAALIVRAGWYTLTDRIFLLKRFSSMCAVSLLLGPCWAAWGHAWPRRPLSRWFLPSGRPGLPYGPGMHRSVLEGLCLEKAFCAIDSNRRCAVHNGNGDGAAALT